MRRLLAVLAALVLLAGCGSSGDQAAAPQSKRLPDLTLQGFQGGPSLDLGELRGPAVINLWASWCGPCRREMPVIEEFSQQNPGVPVLGIDFQDRQEQAAADLVRRTGVSYPIYADPTGELSGRAPFPRVRGLPFTVLVDERGRLVYGEYVEIKDVAQLEQLVREHLGGRGLS